MDHVVGHKKRLSRIFRHQALPLRSTLSARAQRVHADRGAHFLIIEVQQEFVRALAATIRRRDFIELDLSQGDEASILKPTSLVDDIAVSPPISVSLIFVFSNKVSGTGGCMFNA